MRHPLCHLARHRVATLGCMVALFASACTTERASQPGAMLETTNVEWGLRADITVDMSRKLMGSARKSRLLFFTIDGPTRFAEGVFVSTKQGLLTWLFGGADDDLKAAAAYEAVYGKADVLVNPQWITTKEDYLFFAVTKVSVSGFAGTIRSYHSSFEAARGRASTGSSDTPRTQAFSSPASLDAPSPLRPTSTDFDLASDESLMLASIAQTRTSDPSVGVGPTLRINDLTGGTGPAAVDGDIVSYHYACSVKGGSPIFDSRGQGLPRSRVAGSADAPIGLGKALIGARPGMHRQVTIPPELAYGVQGLPSAKVPPDATLVMDVYVDQVRPARN